MSTTNPSEFQAGSATYSGEWPAIAKPFHDARDDDVIYLSPEEIEAALESIRRPKVLPAPITDPALADREEEL